MRLSDSQERTESEWALEALRCEGHSLQELLDLWEFENAPEDEWEEFSVGWMACVRAGPSTRSNRRNASGGPSSRSPGDELPCSTY